jgi:Zn-dependent metalloprotease
VSFSSDEAAARYHLSGLFERDDRGAFRGVASSSRSERVPELKLVDVLDLPQANRLVRFEQAHAEIPVFGSRAVCELDDSRGFIAAYASMADVRDAPHLAGISPADALRSIAALTGVELESLAHAPAPKLNYFFATGAEEWHLVYVFEGLRALPPNMRETSIGHRMGRSPRTLSPIVTYLVDANDGEVVYHYSATPLIATPVPTHCTGLDEDGQVVTFLGSAVDDQFELCDPLFDVITRDLNFADVGAEPPAPQAAIRSVRSDWTDKARAAVSAHVNATVVSRFYKGILARDGIDGKGMNLVNVVNCTYAKDQAAPMWENAVWYDSRMWYGQAADRGGRLVSFSRHLDIIAHELTHGLTEHTAGLVYRDEPGALNESLSDIFAILIKNWDFAADDGGDVETWNWDIGSGLGGGALPLRNLADPSLTGDPVSYADRYIGDEDEGGVHTNSNIHNKAAHNLLTLRNEAGDRSFAPRDVALLYYYALLSMSALADFRDMLAVLVDVASTMFAGDAAAWASKERAIRQAYASVGIMD